MMMRLMINNPRSVAGMRASYFLALLLCSFASAAVAHDITAPGQRPSRLERRVVNVPIKDFVLVDQNNRAFNFATLRGKLVVVTFGYTTCPDICPLTTAALRQLQDRLGRDERSRVYLLMITTDPEVDSPAVLAAYAKRYSVDLSNWSFLSGDPAVLAKVWKAFGVTVQRRARGLIDHTSLTALVDGRGVMRYVYYGTAPDTDIVGKDLTKIVAER
jgi:protein SCO1